MINHPVDSLYGCRTCRYTVSTTTSLISRSIGAALSVASGSPGTVLPIPNEEGRRRADPSPIPSRSRTAAVAACPEP
jgi:hypothetical protein